MTIPAAARRIAIIGNGGGGKSTLAARVARARRIPWREVDRVQFGANWVPTEDVSELRDWALEDEWVIDGFGPWDLLVERFDRADVVVFVDHPLWVHNWLASRRQLDAELGLGRTGGRPDCDLRDMHQRMFETIERVNREIRPRLLEHFQSMKTPLVTICGVDALDVATRVEVGEEAAPMAASIRPAVVSDVSRLAELHAAFCSEQRVYDDVATPNPAFDPEAYFRRRLGETSRATIVAESEGKIVGFVDGMLFSKGNPPKKRLAFLRPAPEEPLHLPVVAGYLNNVFVVEEARRAGIAARLISALGDWMRGVGAGGLYTDVSEGNGASVRMFESAGFYRVRTGMRWDLDG